MALQQYFGRFPITNASKDFTLERVTAPAHGPVAAALTTGYYYLHGWTGEAIIDGGPTDQLIEHMQAVIRAWEGGARFPAAAVTYDDATGKVTIDYGGVDGDLVWTDTALRDLLGFAGDLTGADAYEADNQARYVWRPAYTLTDYPGDRTAWWAPDSTSISRRADDGTTFGLKGEVLYGGDFEYQLLPETDVIICADTVAYESLEQFWLDVVHEAQPIRCYPDRTLNAEADIRIAEWAGGDEGVIGSWMEYRERQESNYNGDWSVRLPLWKSIT